MNQNRSSGDDIDGHVHVSAGAAQTCEKDFAEEYLSHKEAFASFSDGLKELLEDRVLKYLPSDVSRREVEMQLALHQGRAITVFVKKCDEVVVPIPVLQGARVKDFKAAIQMQIGQQIKRSGGPAHISWRSIWRSYWLCFGKVRLTDENGLLSDYGVGNRDEVTFTKRLRERHGRKTKLG